MINNVYQLVGTKTLVVKFEDISLAQQVVVRPDYLAICHADQRYYLGLRSPDVLRKKLPMAPVHEACGTVVADPTETFNIGDRVVMIPNVSGDVSSGLFENYAPGSAFLSSGQDGFMREFVALPPDRLVSCAGIDPIVASITEFISVSMHAVTRFDALAHNNRDRFAIIGDGSMAYVTACVLKEVFPAAEIVVLGHNPQKLALFTFVDQTLLSNDIPEGFSFDHGFECAGSEGSVTAIETLIAHINPQGCIMLLGVSEQPVPVNTRMVLEKGLTMVGCSRSGRADFERAIELMFRQKVQRRLREIIFLDDAVYTVADIKRVFANDLLTPFKTVFEWRI